LVVNSKAVGASVADLEGAEDARCRTVYFAAEAFHPCADRRRNTLRRLGQVAIRLLHALALGTHVMPRRMLPPTDADRYGDVLKVDSGGGLWLGQGRAGGAAGLLGHRLLDGAGLGAVTCTVTCVQYSAKKKA